MAANYTDVAVVMVPYPIHGHLTPLLRLSGIISSYGIPVHYGSIGARIQELKLRDQTPNIHFHDLSPPPASKITSNVEGLEEDDFYSSLQLLGEPLCALCSELSTTYKRVVIIHDNLMLQCVQRVHEVLTTNVETYIFHAIPAFTVYSWIQEAMRNDDYDDLFLPFEAHLPSTQSIFHPQHSEFIKLQRDLASKYAAGEIFNSCRDIESTYLDAFAKQSGKPVWGLGPFNPVHIPHIKKKSNTYCIEWLDKQPKRSVILVSFGTVTTFSNEQINELATGLERSEKKFIWILRSRDKRVNDYSTYVPNIELPTGFEERVGERGIIARDWVPQLEILAHPSTGGYMFHSGWNSFLESISMGVPMATWPMHSDNPFNDVLITKVLKVALVVKDWACKHELVTSSTIENAVRTLMDSPQGEELRKRAIELSKVIKMSLSDGGTTHKQMESFIAHITR